MKNVYFLIISIFIFTIQNLNGQVNTVVAGGTVNGSGGEVTYTIGQIDYTYIEDSIGSLNFGVQQPYEIYFLRINEPIGQNGSIMVYPNPACDFINVSCTMKNLIKYQILDSHGRIISEGCISDQLQLIDIQSLATGIYFIRVLSDNITFEVNKFSKF